MIYEPKERCGCGDPDCRACYPRKSKRQAMLDDDDYGDQQYESRKQRAIDDEWEREQGRDQ